MDTIYRISNVANSSKLDELIERLEKDGYKHVKDATFGGTVEDVLEKYGTLLIIKEGTIVEKDCIRKEKTIDVYIPKENLKKFFSDYRSYLGYSITNLKL